jgi:hypothetical protein
MTVAVMDRIKSLTNLQIMRQPVREASEPLVPSL